MKDKIKTRKELIWFVEELKKKKKMIVTCNGSFDIMHIGHVWFLQEAKKQGDILIVGLNSDASVKRYKGPNRPVNKQEQRAEMVAALEMVNFVTIFDELDPRALLEAIKPHVHCNGEEYGKNCMEAETVRKNGGRLHLIKRFGDFSTTEMIKKIKKIY
ncbi:adenylyltransferase/cytidyltransferase family protein [Candidatus Woesearchaeota archaeon]|nr:adenylyltransferase/cytidyltransferase family protein [Candidatus Woesearchaeota archaeon]